MQDALSPLSRGMLNCSVPEILFPLDHPGPCQRLPGPWASVLEEVGLSYTTLQGADPSGGGKGQPCRLQGLWQPGLQGDLVFVVLFYVCVCVRYRALKFTWDCNRKHPPSQCTSGS